MLLIFLVVYIHWYKQSADVNSMWYARPLYAGTTIHDGRFYRKHVSCLLDQYSAPARLDKALLAIASAYGQLIEGFTH